MDQKTVDLIFAMVLTATGDKIFCEKPIGKKAAWIANTLRKHGIDTHPIGANWGTIVTKEFRDKYSVIDNDLDTY